MIFKNSQKSCSKKATQKSDLFTQIVIFCPAFLLLILILPVFSGILGVLLPAFGFAPAIGHTTFGLQGFMALWQTPGLPQMMLLSASTGLISTLLALILTLMMLGAFFNSKWLNRIQRLLSPILVIPHAAAAIAIGFLIAPSGIISRIISPWLSGWELAPNGIFPHDPYGISIILGLILKELPFLLLISLGVLAQPELSKKLHQQHKVALNLGYGSMIAFFKVILPSLYPLIRLPILAVLAYASASVEMPLILGPNTPPTLAVAIMHWFNDVDLNIRIKASAGAVLQLAITGVLLSFWVGAEKVIKARLSVFLTSGNRHYGGLFWQKITMVLTFFVIGVLLLSFVGIVMWSIAGFWRFPAVLPEQLTLLHFSKALTQVGVPMLNTLIIGIAATLCAILLTLLCLEAEQLNSKPLSRLTNLIIYLPLLVPSIAFIFGLVWIQQFVYSESSFFNVILTHLLFVLPYVFLSLASSYRRLDPRLAQVGASLGAKPYKVFLKIKLPQLFPPILVAAALGLAISFGQYLPTILAGGGRIATITTEAVTLANGASRRTSAVYGMIQMLLPLLGFMLAWILPKYFYKSAY